jgi:alpha-galactosidase
MTAGEWWCAGLCLGNDCGSVVTEDHVKATAEYMISSGLAAKGFVYVNVDEGWLLGRDPKTKAMVEDKNAFPSGMAGLGAWVHNLTVPGKGKIMQYGLYTSRGVQQCDTAEYQKRCMHMPPNPTSQRCEGSHGYEAADAQWMVAAGADYVKVVRISALQRRANTSAPWGGSQVCG